MGTVPSPDSTLPQNHVYGHMPSCLHGQVGEGLTAGLVAVFVQLSEDPLMFPPLESL